ncbi:MAG: bifunctional [glutamine synthetase] adenylyltransferase/[glutamine synthetase]-adenylyl-L-tyrosine phosphorylase, partial [Pseudomonadota bacterium]
RLTRDLVQILSERTRDGYVFRTDLRLRPDPGAMPVALSTLTAETYYEGLGRTWERLAYIKARVCAGDEAAGAEFLETLRPFVWRRYLDFATLSEVRALKERINDHFGHGALAVAGHDLKRGRGGIREIEFYAQTQQIIFGGRDETLRGRQTLSALDALVSAGWTEPQVRGALRSAYTVLRDLEHRLQMLADMQTQTLPEPGDDLDRVARLAGCADGVALDAKLAPILKTVSEHFDALFARLPGGTAKEVAEPAEGSMAERLARLGFARPEDGATLIAVWMQGRYPAMRGERARETLRVVLPPLLEALAASPDPDRGLARLDAAFSRLPTGLQFFAMLAARPKLIALVAEVAGLDAPLAEHLARNPDVLGEALEADFWTALPDRAAHEAELAEAIARDPAFEAALDAVRRYHAGAHFRIGIHVLRGLADPDEAGLAFTALAEACIAALLPVALAEVERRHGALEGGGIAVVAMGRVGAGEMTAASDLDLLFVASGESAEMSEGRRPISRERWAAALGQTLVTALTSPTAAGRLYEVDMRLRPSGKSGPLVTTLSAFRTYHAETAQTWEALARTRARVIAGPPHLASAVAAAISEAQSRALPPKPSAEEVRDMRALIAKERRPRGRWDVKLIDGGLFDMEFTAQLLQIVSGRPATAHTARAIRRLQDEGALSDGDAERLLAAHHDYSALLQRNAVAAPSVYDPDDAGQCVREGVRKALNAASDAAVLERLAEHGRACEGIFALAIASLSAPAR